MLFLFTIPVIRNYRSTKITLSHTQYDKSTQTQRQRQKTEVIKTMTMTMSIQSSAATAAVSATATAADIGLLSTCAFLGTIGASLTGFGQAIIFLFVWQIVELAGYNGDFKSAVFIQALSLFSMQPLVLYKAKVWKNAHRRVLLLFVPITLVSTPLGQLVSDGVPTNIVQAVAGVLVTFVACWELYSKRNWFLSLGPCNNNDKDEKGGHIENETGADDSAPKPSETERGDAGVKVKEAGDESNSNGKKERGGEEKISTRDEEAGRVDPDDRIQLELDAESLENDTSTTTAANVPNVDGDCHEKPSGKALAATATATPPKTTISSVYASLAIGSDNNIDMSTAKSSPQTNIKPAAIQEDEERDSNSELINRP